MSERLIQLAERRATLIARAEHQRDTLAQAIEPWRKPLAIADSSIAAVRYVKQQPALLFGIGALFAVTKPRTLFRWTRRSWVAWRLTRSLKHKLGI